MRWVDVKGTENGKRGGGSFVVCFALRAWDTKTWGGSITVRSEK